MRKRTKIFAGLVAGIMALGAMCFGFAQWSTDITLNGTVNAAGKWDVAITDAKVEQVSNIGAEAEGAYEVVLYPVYVDYKNNYYYFRIDDINTETVSVTADEIAAYDTSIGVSSFQSGAKSGDYTFRLNKNEGVAGIVEHWYNRTSLKAADGGAMDGQCIGTAIAWCYKGFPTNTPDNGNVVLTYDDAKTYLAEHAGTTFTATEVTYATVNFSMPGAWAKYSVTITNNGTAAANLNDLDLTFSDLDAIYSVNCPRLKDDAALQPGESCTFEFVIFVDEEYVEAECGNEFLVNDETGGNQFHLKLQYVADQVEEVPNNLLHSHTGG